MTLGQTSDYLDHKFDVSVRQANKMDIEIPSVSLSAEFDQRPDEPVLQAVLKHEESQYDLLTSFWNDESRAKGHFEVNEKSDGPLMEISYDLRRVRTFKSTLST